MTRQVWYVAYHVLYIYAMFHILMPCFIYLCHYLYIFSMSYLFMPCFNIYAMINIFMYDLYIDAMFYIYVNFNTCCITIHLRCIKISVFVVLSSLIYVLLTQIYVVSTQIYVILTLQIYVASRLPAVPLFHHPIQREVIITCSSLWSYLPYRIWNYKA